MLCICGPLILNVVRDFLGSFHFGKVICYCDGLARCLLDKNVSEALVSLFL